MTKQQEPAVVAGAEAGGSPATTMSTAAHGGVAGADAAGGRT
jgi:hypothetical protein